MDKQKFLIPIVISIAILAIDQLVKYYIKTHFYIGEEVKMFGEWGKLHFTENYGMAYGLEFGGKTGKNILTFFLYERLGQFLSIPLEHFPYH